MKHTPVTWHQIGTIALVLLLIATIIGVEFGVYNAGFDKANENPRLYHDGYCDKRSNFGIFYSEKYAEAYSKLPPYACYDNQGNKIN